MTKSKQKHTNSGKKSKLADMSIDDLMAEDIVSEEEDDDDQHDNNEKTDGKEPKSGKVTKITGHKQSLEKLKTSDPEFFEFLQENEGGLLNFDESDDSEMESEEEEELEDDEEEDGSGDEDDLDTKKPGEVDSDEEDFVDEDDDGSKKKKRGGIPVTLALVDKWRQQLEKNSVKALREAMKAFRAAVQQAGAEERVRTKYAVDGSAAFNAVVSLCLKQVYPVLQRSLELEDKAGKTPPSSSPKWKHHHVDVKAYLTDLIKLLGNVAEPSVVSVVLRHVRNLIPYYTCFPKLVKVIIKKLVNLWSTGEETVRVLAFLCLFSIVRCTKQSRLDFILKQLYLAYVRNTKFTSPSTLPVINFMQRSMTEMFALNTQLTYQHAFIYIRQLAIHLRNAITVKKKDMYQSVYNWQYIHCIYLWCRVLATLHNDETLKPLVYPLVQTSIGVIKLIPAARYYPLRFHVVRALNLLSEATGTFIPLLPFVLEVLQQTDFNKKHSIASFKPLNFAVMLRLSNSQLKERAFKDGVMDQVYDLLIEHLQVHCHRIGFPELALPVVLELRTFLKKCKVANFTRQMKQFLDKVLENCQEITKRRERVSFGLADDKAVRQWEMKNREQGTAILKSYDTYKKLRERELKHEEAGKERLVDDKIPTMTQSKKRKLESKMEMKDLFKKDVGSDDEEDLFKRVERKQKRLEERPKKKGKYRDDDEDDDDDDDDLEDLDEDDFADLSDDDDDEDEADEADQSLTKVPLKKSSKKASKPSQRKEDTWEEKDDQDDVVEDFAMWSDEDGEEGSGKTTSSKKTSKTSKSKPTGRQNQKKSPKLQKKNKKKLNQKS
ncbi:nucleolar complex protein 2 homolog [Strongylocentrotus purpuratus]|uniref:Nucleolar complex protein 2 homolog n=1 Tax=Strongylocentrotus purpuratus TaxID=7668 RepID=A0A7M7P1W3_STRPU|nr:nucleolar complex protein 2 homolog [Strongylocentrotus purpuratus]XP_030842652.1 nucleolar complex protein 2 homolog [Strongylocentrotus purpuratus]